MFEQDAEASRRKVEEAATTPVYVALFDQPGAGKSSLINAILIKTVVSYASGEGATPLLKQFVGRAVAAEMTKYIPFVGPLVAGTIGFGTIRMVLTICLDACFKIAEEMLAAHFEG